MKSKKLLIVILICVAVFFASTTAGIVLAINTIGQTDPDTLWPRFRDGLTEIFEEGRLFRIVQGNRIRSSIDETLSLDLSGVETIRISGISEKMEIVANNGTMLECRLFGDYFSLAKEMEYTYTRSGSVLHVRPIYPNFGYSSLNLQQQIQIPADFAGVVQINSVSGAQQLHGQSGLAWSSLRLENVSGSISVIGADIPSVSFNNISGRITLDGCSGQVSGKTVSGAIQIDWVQFHGAEVESVSGRVSLTLPVDLSSQFTFKSVSGSFTNNGLPLEISSQTKNRINGKFGDGQYQLAVETVSGSVSVNAATPSSNSD